MKYIYMLAIITLDIVTQGKEFVRNSTSDFNINFQDREEVMKYLKEDTGLLIVTTNYYCAINDSDHLLYNSLINDNQKGLIIRMDNTPNKKC